MVFIILHEQYPKTPWLSRPECRAAWLVLSVKGLASWGCETHACRVRGFRRVNRASSRIAGRGLARSRSRCASRASRRARGRCTRFSNPSSRCARLPVESARTSRAASASQGSTVHAAKKSAQLSDLLLEVFHPAFKCLRHAGKINQCSWEFHNEMPSCLEGGAGS